MGRDSFDNIWKKISETLSVQPESQPSPPKVCTNLLIYMVFLFLFYGIFLASFGLRDFVVITEETTKNLCLEPNFSFSKFTMKKSVPGQKIFRISIAKFDGASIIEKILFIVMLCFQVVPQLPKVETEKKDAVLPSEEEPAAAKPEAGTWPNYVIALKSVFLSIILSNICESMYMKVTWKKFEALNLYNW